jgi:hypothetical protein
MTSGNIRVRKRQFENSFLVVSNASKSEVLHEATCEALLHKLKRYLTVELYDETYTNR